MIGAAWCFLRGRHRWDGSRPTFKGRRCLTCGYHIPANLGEWGTT